jgi:hypothetical protein
MSLWLCIYAFALPCGSLICLLLTYVVHMEFNFSTQMWHKSITLLKVVLTIILSCTMTLLCTKFLMVIIYLVYAENILLHFACKWCYCYWTLLNAVISDILDCCCARHTETSDRLNRIKTWYKWYSTFWSTLPRKRKVKRSAIYAPCWWRG